MQGSRRPVPSESGMSASTLARNRCYRWRLPVRNCVTTKLLPVKSIHDAGRVETGDGGRLFELCLFVAVIIGFVTALTR